MQIVISFHFKTILNFDQSMIEIYKKINKIQNKKENLKMKKILALMLAMILVISVVACGKSNDKTTAPVETTGSQNNSTEPTETKDSTGEVVVPNASVEDVMKAISEIDDLKELTMMMDKAEAGYLRGFDEEISGFKDGYVMGPMIGSIPFVGYVFQTEDNESANALLETLKSKANMRWNICTEADTMITDVKGNYVLFFMVSAEQVGEATPDNIKNAFENALK